ncbi:pyridoxal phosphate-dependent aminotransferase [bacterium]|nr:pyridoxal phosphate-dependent aminotransferase [bacterium]
MKRPDGSLISFMSNLVKKNGGINCAQGIPGFEPPKELIEELVSAAKTQIHQYPAGNGNPELRGLVASGLCGNCGISAENVLVTNGATEAISLIYLYLRQKTAGKFTVLSFDPVYESYANLPKIYGDRFLCEYPDDSGTFDFDALEERVKNEKVNLVLLCSPGNPLGKIWKKEEISRLYEICKKYGANLVFDSVYSDLYFGEKPYLPFELVDETLFVVSAFSKMLSITGWRVGYIVGSVQHIENLAKIHDYTGLCTPSVLQAAIAGYLEKNDFGRDYLAFLRGKVRESFEIMYSALQKSGFLMPSIDGGYFVWAKIPQGFDDGFKFAMDLYESKKVGTVPGIHFSEKGNEFIRISIAKEASEIAEAASRIADFVK